MGSEVGQVGQWTTCFSFHFPPGAGVTVLGVPTLLPTQDFLLAIPAAEGPFLGTHYTAVSQCKASSTIHLEILFASSQSNSGALPNGAGPRAKTFCPQLPFRKVLGLGVKRGSIQ